MRRLAEQLRLIVQLQLIAADRLAQLCFQRHALLRHAVHVGTEEAETPAAFLLGAVHCQIGMPQQDVDIAPVLGKHRHADAGRRVHGHVAHRQRAGDGAEQAFGGGAGLLGAALRQGQGEFIAGQARQHGSGGELFTDTQCDVAQQAVAGRVTLAVVDQLEAVDVDEHQRSRLAGIFGMRQGLLGAGTEHDAVGQAGECVIEGQLMHALADLFALQRQGAQLLAQVSELDVPGIGAPHTAVIQRKGAEHARAVGADRRAPAGTQAHRQQQITEMGKQRIVGDVFHHHRAAAPGSGAAGAGTGADLQAIDRIGILGRQAGRGQRVQAAVVVGAHHRGQHFRGDAFHLGADQRHHFD